MRAGRQVGRRRAPALGWWSPRSPRRARGPPRPRCPTARGRRRRARPCTRAANAARRAADRLNTVTSASGRTPPPPRPGSTPAAPDADHADRRRVRPGQQVDGRATERAGTPGADLLARPRSPGSGRRGRRAAPRAARRRQCPKVSYGAEAVPLVGEVSGGHHQPPALEHGAGPRRRDQAAAHARPTQRVPHRGDGGGARPARAATSASVRSSGTGPILDVEPRLRSTTHAVSNATNPDGARWLRCGTAAPVRRLPRTSGAPYPVEQRRRAPHHAYCRHCRDHRLAAHPRRLRRVPARQAGRAFRPYLVLNIVGAGILAMIAASQRSWGFLLLEGTWTIVSAISLAARFNRRGGRPASLPARRA